MSKQNLSAGRLFDQIPLTASQRLRAEANMRRGEFFADLMLRAFHAIGQALQSLRSHAKQAKHAKPAHRLGPAS